jgi:hypothetical protein
MIAKKVLLIIAEKFSLFLKSLYLRPDLKNSVLKWRGSSVGKSAGFITRRSRVQLSPSLQKKRGTDASVPLFYNPWVIIIALSFSAAKPSCHLYQVPLQGKGHKPVLRYLPSCLIPQQLRF